MSAAPRVSVRYDVVVSDDWTLPEETVPESAPHDQTIDLLKAILLHWIARTGRDAQVARNLAVRWVPEQPQIGSDPDLCVLDPPPPERNEVVSLCTWQPGHVPPKLAVEIVSGHPRKDYVEVPERCAACGVGELWIFDPKLAGPKHGGGPHRLQVWRREGDDFRRIHAGEGPAWSPFAGAWLFAVDEGQRLRIAADRDGASWWHTGEEAERAAREAERARREAAEREVAELRAKLAELEAKPR